MSEKMMAHVLHGVGDLRYEQVQIPELSAHTALVRVRAAGICGSDIPRVYVNGTYHFPTIPGHEFSGEVAAVSEGADDAEKEWIGKRVGIFPLIPCGECGPCRRKLYEMCQRYSYLGSREDGGFAEYVKVPVWNLIPLPDQVSFEQAAMMEPMAVAVHAIRKAFAPLGGVGDTGLRAAVCGLGTIGMLIVMFLKGMGFKTIIGIGNKDFQKEIFLQTTGQEGQFIDSRSCADIPAAIDEMTGGADVFFECVGRPDTISTAVSSAAPGGSVQLVGNPASDITLDRDVYWRILRRQLIVTGSWNSSYTHEQDDDWNDVMGMLAEGKVHPEKLITHRLPMDQLQSGLELMREKREPYIKVMGIKHDFHV